MRLQVTTALCVLPHPIPRNARPGLLCLAHHNQLEQTLAEMPALIFDVWKHVLPGATVGQRVTGTREKPMPINENASDAWRLARDALASWASMVSEETDTYPPLPMIEETSRYLLRHLDWIVEQPWVDQMYGEIDTARKAMRAVTAPVRTKRVPIGPCAHETGCDVTTGTTIVCAGTLKALVHLDDTELPATITCTSCGQEHASPEWRALSRRLRQTDEQWLTLAQIAMAFNVGTKTLRKWAKDDGWQVMHGPKLRHGVSRLWAYEDAQRSYQQRRMESA